MKTIIYLNPHTKREKLCVFKERERKLDRILVARYYQREDIINVFLVVQIFMKKKSIMFFN